MSNSQPNTSRPTSQRQTPRSAAAESSDQTPTRIDLGIDPAELTQSEINGARIAFGVSGALAIVLGILVLSSPEVTLSFVAFLFGLYFLVSGVVRVVRGIAMSGKAGGRVLSILFGVLLLVAGIVTIRNPLDSLVVLGLVIGLSWIIEGIAALVEAAPDSSRWFGILLGVISVVAGIVMLFAPLESLGVLVILGGIFLIVSGAVQLLEAFTFGRKSRSAAGGSTSRVAATSDVD